MKLLFSICFVLVLSCQIFAHGGEDHGAGKPQTTTSTQGTVSVSKNVGEVELLLKYVAFKPDLPNSARLFFSNFATNEAIKDVTPKVEIIDHNGNSQEVAVKKNETNGSFDLQVPPIVQGEADFRITFKHDGKSETATFGNISVEPKADVSPLGTSYFVFALWLSAFVLLLGMFCGLAYAVWQSSNQIKNSSLEIEENSVVAEA
jgi:hypothetical protein